MAAKRSNPSPGRMVPNQGADQPEVDPILRHEHKVMNRPDGRSDNRCVGTFGDRCDYGAGRHFLGEELSIATQVSHLIRVPTPQDCHVLGRHGRAERHVPAPDPLVTAGGSVQPLQCIE